jgi:hypothetical protein
MITDIESKSETLEFGKVCGNFVSDRKSESGENSRVNGFLERIRINLFRCMFFKFIAIKFNRVKTSHNITKRVKIILYSDHLCVGLCSVNASRSVYLKNKESGYFYKSGNFCSGLYSV